MGIGHLGKHLWLYLGPLFVVNNFLEEFLLKDYSKKKHIETESSTTCSSKTSLNKMQFKEIGRVTAVTNLVAESIVWKATDRDTNGSHTPRNQSTGCGTAPTRKPRSQVAKDGHDKKPRSQGAKKGQDKKRCIEITPLHNKSEAQPFPGKRLIPKPSRLPPLP